MSLSVERFLLAPFLAVGRVGQPLLDVGLQFLGPLVAQLLQRHGDVGRFLQQRVLGHLQLGLDLDQFLGHRGVGEVLLGQLAQIGVQVLHELRPIVLGGGHAS